MNFHTLFDLAASLCAMGLTVAVYHWRLRNRVEQTVARVGPVYVGPVYFVVLVAGAALGVYRNKKTATPGRRRGAAVLLMCPAKMGGGGQATFCGKNATAPREEERRRRQFQVP